MSAIGTKKISIVLVLVLGTCISGCSGQQVFGVRYLPVAGKIVLAGVKGRIDHMDINPGNQQVYISALGNNSLEVVDLAKRRLVRTIPGLDHPQGVVYIPRYNEVMVANAGNGQCDFFDAASWKELAVVRLSGDADNVRLDSAGRKIYVGYGSDGIAVIDARTHRETGVVHLPVHPESFQLDEPADRIYVNLPDAEMTAVIDLEKLKLTGEWRRVLPAANFPMAMDFAKHLLFIGYRMPARLIVADSRTGRAISEVPLAPDADDLYFDATTQYIFASCGSGYIDLFRLGTSGVPGQIASVPTREGSRTSLLVPSLRLYLLAERAAGGRPAQLVVYRIMK